MFFQIVIIIRGSSDDNYLFFFIFQPFLKGFSSNQWHFLTRAIRLLRSRWGCLRTGIINCRLFEMRFKWLHLHEFRLLFFIWFFFNYYILFIFPPMYWYYRKISWYLNKNKYCKRSWTPTWLNCNFSFLPHYITFRHS